MVGAFITTIAALALVVNIIQPSEAFSAPRHHRRRVAIISSASSSSSSSSSSSALHAASPSSSSRINQKIDLDSPKVATIDKLFEGKGGGESKKVYCRCWQSNTFPLCNGAHVTHNKETGDNVGPLIVSVAAASTAAQTATATSVSDEKELAAASSTNTTGWGNKLKSIFNRNKHDNNNGGNGGLTTRERLAKMGLSALLSYGWVSNMSYAVTLSLSWYGFSKKTGMSPLAPGQWKPYLAVYAGFYVFNNFLRPFRLGLSVIVSKYFDSFVNFIQTKTKLSRKWSIGIVVFLANICGTLSAMTLGVLIASTASGVPIFPSK
ncbi:hypothetical protein ACHAWU_007726 [Discostella pseudostelligera]|uniref:Iron-binding zinc finger CDGSH type domain-containing protein n=1 Tax=Discostella pseudostelligera TaxID=259834 RepID=A0ABD3M8P1_9STRA